jgi:hypothetical protein
MEDESSDFETQEQVGIYVRFVNVEKQTISEKFLE